MIILYCFMITTSNIKIAEHHDHHFSCFDDWTTFDIKSSVLITETIQLLNSQLPFKFIKDYHIMVVWVETNPVTIVRPLVSPTGLHYLSKNSALACIRLTMYPIVTPFVARVKLKPFWYCACWHLLQLFSFKFLIHIEVSLYSLEILWDQNLRMLLNYWSCESSRLKQLSTNHRSLILPCLNLYK